MSESVLEFLRRHILRRLADEWGFQHRAPPGGRPFNCGGLRWCRGGGRSDVTVRQGDQLICCESPAPAIDDQLRQEWYRATTLLGELLSQAFVAVFSLHDDQWALHELNEHLPPFATPGQFLIHLAIRVYRPKRP